MSVQALGGVRENVLHDHTLGDMGERSQYLVKYWEIYIIFYFKMSANISRHKIANVSFTTTTTTTTTTK